MVVRAAILSFLKSVLARKKIKCVTRLIFDEAGDVPSTNLVGSFGIVFSAGVRGT